MIALIAQRPDGVHQRMELAGMVGVIVVDHGAVILALELEAAVRAAGRRADRAAMAAAGASTDRAAAAAASAFFTLCLPGTLSSMWVRLLAVLHQRRTRPTPLT